MKGGEKYTYLHPRSFIIIANGFYRVFVHVLQRIKVGTQRVRRREWILDEGYSNLKAALSVNLSWKENYWKNVHRSGRMRSSQYTLPTVKTTSCSLPPTFRCGDVIRLTSDAQAASLMIVDWTWCSSRRNPTTLAEMIPLLALLDSILFRSQDYIIGAVVVRVLTRSQFLYAGRVQRGEWQLGDGRDSS